VGIVEELVEIWLNEVCDNWQDIEDVRRQEREKGTFKRKELPGRFTAKKLYGWSDKKYDKEY